MLLEIPDTVKGSYIKELASALKQVSVILALQVLLKGNVPIERNIWHCSIQGCNRSGCYYRNDDYKWGERGKKTEDRKTFFFWKTV